LESGRRYNPCNSGKISRKYTKRSEKMEELTVSETSNHEFEDLNLTRETGFGRDIDFTAIHKMIVDIAQEEITRPAFIKAIKVSFSFKVLVGDLEIKEFNAHLGEEHPYREFDEDFIRKELKDALARFNLDRRS
jgi:hypothetical protein